MVMIKTGGEVWGFIADFDNNHDFVLHSLVEYIIIAKKKFPNEKTYIIYNDEELVKKAKKMAEKILKKETYKEKEVD